eukprot:SM010010S09547  [mRNA]  locus=s10010:19:436:- [translate_table: standard]
MVLYETLQEAAGQISDWISSGTRRRVARGYLGKAVMPPHVTKAIEEFKAAAKRAAKGEGIVADAPEALPPSP